MRIIIITLITLFFAVSCENSKRKKAADTTVADTIAPVMIKVPVHGVQEFRPDSSLIPWEGQLKASITWIDSKGENFVVVSALPQYFWEEEKPERGKLLTKDQDKDTDSELTEIYARQYIYDKAAGKWQLYLEHHDYLFGCCDVFMEYVPYSIQISDLDTSGTGEATFMYYETAGTGIIDHTYTGFLVTLKDSAAYVTEGPWGAGWAALKKSNQNVPAVKYNENAGNTYLMFFKRTWDDLSLRQTEMDRNNEIK